MDFQLNRIVFKTVGVQHKTLKITSESKKTSSEAVAQRCSVKKGFLRTFAKFSGKQLCQNLSLGLGLQIY